MTRSEYVHSLTVLPALTPLPSGLQLSTVGAADAELLAVLMLDAYRGTIDDDDETLDDARSEIGGFLGDGAALLDCSYVLRDGANVAAAVLSRRHAEEAMIGYVMTHPGFKRRGLATLLVTRATAAVAAAGYGRLHAFITDGNVASETVFLRCGFTRMGAVS